MGNYVNSTLSANTYPDQIPTTPTSFTDLGTHETDNTPAISWTKGQMQMGI